MAQASNATPEFLAYNQAEQLTFAQAVALALLYFQTRQEEPVSDAQWVSLIDVLFPYVKAYRDISARSARSYYDGERQRFQFSNVLDLDRLRTNASTQIQRLPIFLANYKPQWLRRALEPVRERIQQENTSDGAIREAAATVGKEVLNGGRTTIIQAVPNDPLKPKWARVQGGNESCAFCWMLISRGPVYDTAESAGQMEYWHPNCDCRVVPVFDTSADWPGKDDWLEAEEVWKRVTKGTKGIESLKAFRRALGDGYKTPTNPALPVPQAA